MLRTAFLDPCAIKMNKMHMYTVMYHVSMYMFYVILCVQTGKGFCFICVWLGCLGAGNSVGYGWGNNGSKSS